MAHHHSHNHDHYDGEGHGGDHGHGHGDDHSHDAEPALQSSLYRQIDFDGIVTLNEARAGAGRAIVQKAWSERLSVDAAGVLESGADEQLLMHVPLTAACRLFSLLVRSSDSPSAPLTLKLFRNRGDNTVDFGTAAELAPTQQLSLPRSNAVVEVPLNRSRWNGTTSVDLFFVDNHSRGDDDVTRLSYLGFRGEPAAAINRDAVQHVVYEAAPNPAEHRSRVGATAASQLMTGQ